MLDDTNSVSQIEEIKVISVGNGSVDSFNSAVNKALKEGFVLNEFYDIVQTENGFGATLFKFKKGE